MVLIPHIRYVLPGVHYHTHDIYGKGEELNLSFWTEVFFNNLIGYYLHSVVCMLFSGIEPIS